jgi:hypothetical protein
MRLFSQTRTLSERFPAERLSHLSIALSGSIENCIREAGLDHDEAWGSRFISGYLLGYPSVLDEIDERFGASIRKMLFDSIFGSEEGNELYRASMGHFLLNDVQTKRGWGAGVRDGERYFQALERRQNAEGSTNALIALFKIGCIDVGPQTL